MGAILYFLLLFLLEHKIISDSGKLSGEEVCKNLPQTGIIFPTSMRRNSLHFILEHWIISRNFDGLTQRSKTQIIEAQNLHELKWLSNTCGATGQADREDFEDARGHP
jgi:hypothetical protein